jgi:hypothetical protein
LRVNELIFNGFVPVLRYARVAMLEERNPIGHKQKRKKSKDYEPQKDSKSNQNSRFPQYPPTHNNPTSPHPEHKSKKARRRERARQSRESKEEPASNLLLDSSKNSWRPPPGPRCSKPVWMNNDQHKNQQPLAPPPAKEDWLEESWEPDQPWEPPKPSTLPAPPKAKISDDGWESPPPPKANVEDWETPLLKAKSHAEDWETNDSWEAVASPIVQKAGPVNATTTTLAQTWAGPKSSATPVNSSNKVNVDDTPYSPAWDEDSGDPFATLCPIVDTPASPDNPSHYIPIIPTTRVANPLLPPPMPPQFNFESVGGVSNRIPSLLDVNPISSSLSTNQHLQTYAPHDPSQNYATHDPSQTHYPNYPSVNPNDAFQTQGYAGQQQPSQGWNGYQYPQQQPRFRAPYPVQRPPNPPRMSPRNPPGPPYQQGYNHWSQWVSVLKI